MPKVRVSLFLSGDHVPLNDITEEIGVLPTKVRKKEDFPVDSILAGVAKDTWEFRTDKIECSVISTQLDKIKIIFGPKIEIIKDLSKRYLISVNIIIMVEAEMGEYPEFVLTRENIDFLSLLHSEIGFDLYINE